MKSNEVAPPLVRVLPDAAALAAFMTAIPSVIGAIALLVIGWIVAGVIAIALAGVAVVALLNAAFAMERAFIDRDRTSAAEIAGYLGTGTFFVITGFHGLHVIGGLLAFIFFLMRTTMSRFTSAQATAAIVVSYYWHFVDVVWIGLFTVIYLIH